MANRARKSGPAERGGERRSSTRSAAVVPPPAPDPALTALQERFCQELLITPGDACAAYRRAAGRPVKAAKQIAYEMQQLPHVAARLVALRVAQSQRTALTADVVLGELLRIGTCDIGQAFDDQGLLKPLREMPEEVRRAISSIEVDEIIAKHGGKAIVVGHTKKVKFWSKTESLRDLGRHLKLFTDKLEVVDAAGRADRLTRARGRVAS